MNIGDVVIPIDCLLVWYNVYGFKMASIREIALREPLVDVVESHSVVTNSVRIKVNS
jgi:hypothetical protein